MITSTRVPSNWAKRYSIQEGLNGAVTIQEFGRYAADAQVHLEETFEGGGFCWRRGPYVP